MGICVNAVSFNSTCPESHFINQQTVKTSGLARAVGPVDHYLGLLNINAYIVNGNFVAIAMQLGRAGLLLIGAQMPRGGCRKFRSADALVVAVRANFCAFKS